MHSEIVINRPRYGTSVASFILFAVSLMIAAMASMQILVADPDPQNWQRGVALAAVIWLSAYTILTGVRFRTVYLLTSGYIIGLCMFHLAITVPDALQVFTNFGFPDSGSYAEWLRLAGWYTVLALSAIGIGLATVTVRVDNRRPSNPELESHTRALMFWDGVGLLLASGVFLVLAVRSWGNLLHYSRVDFFRGGADTRGIGVFLMTFPAALTLLVVGATGASQRLFAYTLGVLGFIFLSLTGYREAAFFPTLIGAVLWVRTGHRIPTPIAVGFVLLIVIAIPVIGELRSLNSYSDIDGQAVNRSVERFEFQESFRTTGQTAGILAHIIRLVPERDPYRWGETYLEAFKRSVPNVLPQMTRSYRQAAKEAAFSDPDAVRRGSPSDWLTYRISKERYDRGEGVGFSGIGEPYINFGFAGVVAFFVMLGMFLGFVDTRRILHYPNLAVFIAIGFSPLYRTVRNDFTNFVKPVVFICLILLAWRIGNRLFPVTRTYRRRRPSAEPGSDVDHDPVGTS